MFNFQIERRSQVLVNTDSQRRCYNGCHFSSELRWTNWEVLEAEIPEDRIEKRLEFWKSLNDYAVSQRGKGARKEYRAIKGGELRCQLNAISGL